MQAERHNIFFALPNRRNTQRDDMDAVKKIFPKFPQFDKFGQILIRCRDQSEIHLLGFDRADALDTFFVKNSQNLALDAKWERIDFIKKQSAAVSRFYQTHLAGLICAGKAPLFITFKRIRTADSTSAILFAHAYFILGWQLVK